MSEFTITQVREIMLEVIRMADSMRELPMFMLLRDAKRHFGKLVDWNTIPRFGRNNKKYVLVDAVLKAQTEERIASLLGCDKSEVRNLLKGNFVKTSDVLEKIEEVRLKITPKQIKPRVSKKLKTL